MDEPLTSDHTDQGLQTHIISLAIGPSETNDLLLWIVDISARYRTANPNCCILSALCTKLAMIRPIVYSELSLPIRSCSQSKAITHKAKTDVTTSETSRLLGMR